MISSLLEQIPSSGIGTSWMFNFLRNWWTESQGGYLEVHVENMTNTGVPCRRVCKWMPCHGVQGVYGECDRGQPGLGAGTSISTKLSGSRFPRLLSEAVKQMPPRAFLAPFWHHESSISSCSKRQNKNILVTLLFESQYLIYNLIEWLDLSSNNFGPWIRSWYFQIKEQKIPFKLGFNPIKQ